MANDHIRAVSQALLPDPKPVVQQNPPVASGAAADSPAVSPAPAEAVQKQAQQQVSNPNAQAVKQAAESINKFLRSTARELQFQLDKDTGIVVVKVMDKETGDVIRQIPGEETLAIAKSLDASRGVIIRSKA